MASKQCSLVGYHRNDEDFQVQPCIVCICRKDWGLHAGSVEGNCLYLPDHRVIERALTVKSESIKITGPFPLDVETPIPPSGGI